MTWKVHIIKRSKVTAAQNPSRFYECKKNDYLILTIQMNNKPRIAKSVLKNNHGGFELPNQYLL